MSRRPVARRAVGLALLAALLAGGAWLLFVHGVYEPPEHRVAAPAPPVVAPPAPAPVPPLRDPEGAAVLSAQGSVEMRDGPGEWVPVRAGLLLHPDDSLRTGPASRAELGIGDHARLTVAEGTDLTVREVTRAAHRFRLRKGRVSAAYQPDGERVLRIEDESGEVSVETGAATFHVVSAGVTLAVATETGRVNLRTAAGAVDVAAGEQATARPGAAPAGPEPVPARVLLQLAGPAGADPCAAVRGRVTPGTQVTVDGEPAEVDAAGRFALRPRRRSRTSVRVAAVDPAGRTTERDVACREDWHRLSDLEVRWGRAKRP